jgi:hypothetical protein
VNQTCSIKDCVILSLEKVYSIYKVSISESHGVDRAPAKKKKKHT